MKNMSDKIGYVLGTIFVTCLIALLTIGALGAIAIAVIKIWAFFFQLL